MNYTIPLEQATAEIVIKKSRFIAYAKHIVSRETGMAWLSEIKATYPDARHHCWAYLLGNPSCALSAGMGDDGEPSGTAGKPILNVLNHKKIGDVMVIVVRYFGGIKLGAGGLTRAYSQVTQAVMEKLPTEQQVKMVVIQLTCNFALEQKIRYWVDILHGEVLKIDYTQQVEMKVIVPQQEALTLTAQLQAVLCDFKVL
jgi:uncharacterized YigZ family protein